MVNTLVQANDCLFQVKIDDDYVSVLCAKSFTVTINTDEKETTTVSDGAYKSFDYKVLSYTANLNGGMRLPDDVTTTTFDFVNYQQSFLEIPFRCVWIDPDGKVRAFVGTGIIKTNNIVANASQLADATVDILGTGSFEITNTIQNFINLTLISTGSNASPGFAKFKLINADGEVIWQTDTLPEANGSYLANPFNLVKQVPPGTYSIYWYYDSNVIGNNITVNAPPTYSQAFNNGVQSYSSFGIQTYDFTADRTVTFTLGVNNPPPTCVAPTVQQGIASPNGSSGTYYSRNIIIGGSTPISLSNVTKPLWMNVSVAGNTVTVQGNPTLGDNQLLDFDATNACGTVNYNVEIDIAAGALNRIVNYAYTETAAGCAFVIYRNGNAIPVVQLDATGSGQLIVNLGDTLETRVLGPLLTLKALKVEGSTSGVLYDNTTSGNNISYSWVTSGTNIYTITAQGGA